MALCRSRIHLSATFALTERCLLHTYWYAPRPWLDPQLGLMDALYKHQTCVRLLQQLGVHVRP